MPRVIIAKKNKAGKEVKCGRCRKTINPGESYYHFSFRYGGKRYRCGEHRPRPSELTQSKLSAVYAASEGVEDEITLVRANNTETGINDLVSSLENAADEIEGVADEYEESRSNMPEGLQDSEVGERCQENADALREYADTLRSKASELESEWDDELVGDERQELIDRLCDDAESALEELSI